MVQNLHHWDLSQYKYMKPGLAGKLHCDHLCVMCLWTLQSVFFIIFNIFKLTMLNCIHFYFYNHKWLQIGSSFDINILLICGSKAS